jgi:hypothetical protein
MNITLEFSGQFLVDDVEAKTVTQWDSVHGCIHVHGCSFQLGQQVSQLFIGFDLLG